MELEDIQETTENGIPETTDYVEDIKWPEMTELEISKEFIKNHTEFYSKGRNRARQKSHGGELPIQRTPDLIITGAKKCGTSALKIFLNMHPWFQDRVTSGEKS